MNARRLAVPLLLLAVVPGCGNGSKKEVSCPACEGRGVILVWKIEGGNDLAICARCVGRGQLEPRPAPRSTAIHPGAVRWIVVFLGFLIAAIVAGARKVGQMMKK